MVITWNYRYISFWCKLHFATHVGSRNLHKLVRRHVTSKLIAPLPPILFFGLASSVPLSSLPKSNSSDGCHWPTVADVETQKKEGWMWDV
jgi:hypothetical protein